MAKAHSLAELMFLEIRFGVLSARYLPGQTIPKGELGELYECRPAGVAEVLNALAFEGYLTRQSRSEFVVHWQPVVRGRRRVVGAEALVRWQHPERGLLPPDDFVPLAEACGLIRPIGEWTFERALSQAGAWQRDLGLRIDHLLLSPQAADRLVAAGVDRKPRGEEKASDHTPAWCELS